MPNRLIKESIWTSPNLNKLSGMAERHFYRILVYPDDHGCYEATPGVLLGRCYPLKLKEVSEEDVVLWQGELEEAGLILRWNVNGRDFAAIKSWKKHQRIRSIHNRRTPPPPKEIQAELDESDTLLSIDSDLPTIDSQADTNPFILEGVRLKTGLAKLKRGELSKANERRFKSELKKRGLEGKLKE